MLASALVKQDSRTVMSVRELPDPEPGPGEALLEIRAAALNHLDLYARAHHAADPGAEIQVIGSDAAGLVAALGPDVKNLEIGAEVVLNPGLGCRQCEHCLRGQQSECPRFNLVGRGIPGTFAERVVVPAVNLHPKPAHLSFEQAAALCLDHVTAWRMLMTRGDLRVGQSVLIHGIGGGAALASLQLARLLDATVIVTSSSDEKLRRAQELGARHCINYRQRDNVAEAVREITDGRGVDLVIDTVGAETWPVSVAAARNGGRVVVCGATTGAEGVVNIREVFWRQISIVGSTMGSDKDFRDMLAAVEGHALKPVIDSTWPLDEAERALDRLEGGEQFGKIVLSVSDG
jgi:NADPH:quinone reductase-like Zn-dependent oxidoreductase